jgi:adenine-specific DNA glycosylase
VNVTVAAALVERGGRVLLVRRDEGRLLGRFWEVPQTSLDARGRADLVGEARARYGLHLVPHGLAVEARHAITYRRIRVLGYRATLARQPPADPERFRWAAPDDIASLPVSSMTRKVLRGLRSSQLPLELS